MQTRTSSSGLLMRVAAIVLALMLLLGMLGLPGLSPGAVAAEGDTGDSGDDVDSSQVKTFTEWFNSTAWGHVDPDNPTNWIQGVSSAGVLFSPLIVTTDSYVAKIAALFSKKPGDEISGHQLAAYDGSLVLAGSDIPRGYPTNIQLLRGLTSLTINNASQKENGKTTINKSGKPLPGHVFEDVVTLTRQLPNLKTLIVTGGSVQDITTITAENLEYLDLTGNNLVDPRIPNCPKLKTLIIAAQNNNNGAASMLVNPWSSSGGAKLCYQNAPMLETLDLSDNVITAAYLNSLLDAWSGSTTLKTLNLAGNPIAKDAASMAAIAAMLANISGEPPRKLGDVNGDGTIALADAIKICQHVAGIFTLTGDDFAAADVTGDGKVQLVDAIEICKLVAGLITKFPADKS